jgi:chromosomal replication initiator protein
LEILPPSEAWSRILHALRASVSDQTYRTWFSPLRADRIENGRLHIAVPNPFFIDWIQEHYSPLIETLAASELPVPMAVDFDVSGDYADRTKRYHPIEILEAPARSGSSVNGLPAPNGDHCLNARFSFENFVVGKSNEFCVAAAEAVSAKPGQVYNPLFIYGGVGLGKTHVMQAIGNRVLQDRSHAIVRYVSSEKFMNEMIQSIRRGTTFDFKRTYRSADLLLIDDIQFLSGKEGTQEEFFHTFNTLYEANKQIVITSDRAPKELKNLEERLVSRFNWGLVSDIGKPDYETRVAILRRKAELEEASIPDDVIMLVAERITTNVRELEGSLVRLFALASLTGSQITAELAEDLLRDLMNKQVARPVDVADVLRVVSKHFGVSIEALRSKRRTSSLAFARQVGMYLAKLLTGSSLAEIGAQLGGRDHTTVLYACDKIENLRASDPELERTLDQLVGTLRPDHSSGRASNVA